MTRLVQAVDNSFQRIETLQAREGNLVDLSSRAERKDLPLAEDYRSLAPLGITSYERSSLAPL